VVEDTWKVLKLLGIDERYLRLKWISASEGAIFAEEIRSFTNLLKEMGKNPLAEKEPEAAGIDQEAPRAAAVG
jgi:F420-non-reducing hydrogenase iron-sulfur subunit